MKLNRSGFTLLEMMVAVAILSILVSIAIPNFLVWAANQRLRSDMAQLKGDIQIARITAINRNTPVTVLFNAPAVNQYTVFLDDGQGAGGVARDMILNGTEATIIQRSLANGVSLGAINAAGGGFLFNGRGLRSRPQADPANLFITGEGKQYQILVSMMGDIDVNVR